MVAMPSFNIGFGGGDMYPQLQAGAVQGLLPLLQDFGLFCDLLEEQILPEEMEAALEPTLELARDVYCPVDTGELRASAYLEARKNTRGSITCEIGFGRDNIPDYAIAVHEDPNKYHEPPTQYKFLERAVYEDSMDVMDRLYHAVKSRVRV